MTGPRVAVLTPGGHGAIASLRLDDPGNLLEKPGHFRAVNGEAVSGQPLGRACFGHWGDRDVEEVIVCRTSDVSLELHCHGGDAAVRRIVEDLVAAGATRWGWIEQIEAAEGLLAADLAGALASATTWKAAAVLLDQQSGVLHEAFERLAGIDWERRNEAEAAGPLDEILSWGEFGIHLCQPWSVVLAGRPNVGKSSLLNRLLGFGRAIVWDRPGTTRDVVTGSTALDGWAVTLADTAGLRDEADGPEAAGVALARERLADADLAVVVLDRNQPPDERDGLLLGDYPHALVVANKSDLEDAWVKTLPEGAVTVSALTGEGIESLAARIIERLVPRSPSPGTALPVSSRLVNLLRLAAEAVENGDEAEYRTAIRGCLA